MCRLDIVIWGVFVNKLIVMKCNNAFEISLHRKKKDREFPVPSRDVTTKLSLGGNNDVITELFLPRGSLVSDILAGDGKLVNFFTVFHVVPPPRGLHYAAP
jgi:hypothetical protein